MSSQRSRSKVKVKGQGQVLSDNPLKSQILRWGQGQGQGQRSRSRSRSNSFQNHTNQLLKKFGKEKSHVTILFITTSLETFISFYKKKMCYKLQKAWGNQDFQHHGTYEYNASKICTLNNFNTEKVCFRGQSLSHREQQIKHSPNRLSHKTRPRQSFSPQNRTSKAYKYIVSTCNTIKTQAAIPFSEKKRIHTT